MGGESRRTLSDNRRPQLALPGCALQDRALDRAPAGEPEEEHRFGLPDSMCVVLRLQVHSEGFDNHSCWQLKSRVQSTMPCTSAVSAVERIVPSPPPRMLSRSRRIASGASLPHR